MRPLPSTSPADHVTNATHHPSFNGRLRMSPKALGVPERTTMRSRSATRFFTLLMVVLLVGALAAPAEGKRPRRYDAAVLMDWTICPTSAKLTIGFQADSQALPDPNPDETTWPLVDLNAELPDSPGSSLLEGGPRGSA